MENNRIYGDRIYIRPITPEDTDLIVEWRNSDIVMDNFIIREPLSREVHLNWYNTKILNGQVSQFIIYIADGDIPIGSVYMQDIDTLDKSGEFGIFIGDRGTGRGYGREAMGLMMDYGRDVLGLTTVNLRVLAGNEVARHLYKQYGFREIDQETILIEGKPTCIVHMQYRYE